MTADAAPAESASAPLLPESLEYTRRLIAFPSIAQTSNLDIIDYIEATGTPGTAATVKTAHGPTFSSPSRQPMAR